MHHWWKCKLGGTGGKSIEVPQNKKDRTIIDPATPSPGINPKETKSLSQKDIRASTFTAALLTMAKTCKQPK